MSQTYKQKLQSAFESQIADPPSPGVYIIKGDVSGIQDFIFNIQSEGAARMLKTRSFFIQVAVELCIEKIMLDFKKNEPKVISDCGGSFFIECRSEPNRSDLDKLKEQINKELIKYDLYISITANPLVGWLETMELLKIEEETQKLQRYSNWSEAFIPTVIKKHDDANIWKEFAKQLSLSKGYCIKETSEFPGIHANAVVLWGLKFQLEKDNPKVSFDHPKSSLMNLLPLWRNENPYFRAFNDGGNEADDYLENNRKIDDENLKLHDIIDFDHLAIQANVRTGTDDLGILKLDVDNMGKMFREDFTSLYKYVNASEAFSYFFGKYIKDLWTTKTFKSVDEEEYRYCDNILIIYSGGDDCFLLGGWDAVLEFAQMLRDKFKDYSSGIKNKAKRPTFSAAILLLRASTPVIQIGHLAEAKLEKAKQRPGKNTISLFGEVFSWEEFSETKELTIILSKLIKGADGAPPESKALLQKIRLSARGYGALMKKVELKRQVNFQKVWNLTWFIMRNVKNENKEKVEKEIVSKYHDAVLKALMTNEYASALIYPAAARWTELLTRKINQDVPM